MIVVSTPPPIIACTIECDYVSDEPHPLTCANLRHTSPPPTFPHHTPITACDKSCKKACTGPGPVMCVECGSGYEKDDAGICKGE